jgi:hypothetical protein
MLQRPLQFPLEYGSSFEAFSSSTCFLPNAVKQYCQDVCRAIELFEGQKISFDPDENETQANDFYYFYHLRHRITTEFCYLNAEHADSDPRVRCVLLATKIVEYLVLNENYVRAISPFLADQIFDLLDREDLETLWKGHEALLRWTQWTMCCGYSASDARRTRAITSTARRAAKVYRLSPFPLDWLEQGLHRSCVRHFVWAAALDSKLDAVCSEVDIILRHELHRGDGP